MNILSKLFGKKDSELPIEEPSDPRLPIKAISGICKVAPYAGLVTQVHTANWAWGPGKCYFLELKGSWVGVPPMDVIILSSDGGTNGRELVPLMPEEQIEALQFIRDNWTLARPHAALVAISRKIVDNPDPLNCLACGDIMNWDSINNEYTCLCGGVECTKDPHRHWVTISRKDDPGCHR